MHMPSIFSFGGLLIGVFGLGRFYIQILGLDLDIVIWNLFECRPFSLLAFIFIFVGVLFSVRVVVLVLVYFFLATTEVT